MKARFSIFAVITAGAIVLTAFVYFRDTTARLAASPTKPTIISLRLSGQFDPKFAGDIVAARAGIFEAQGLHVEINPRGNGPDPIASVVNGSDTFGVTDEVTFFLARAAGQPIVAFAAGYLESDVVFYSLEKSGIRTPLDLIGKRVGRQDSKDTSIIYDALLKNTGISRSSIRETATETNVGALMEDKVDVIPGHVGIEAFVLHQKGIPYSVIRVSDYGIHLPGTVYFTTEKVIRDRPSTVQRFLQAVIAGWNLTYADYSKSVPLIVAADDKDLSAERVQFQLEAQQDFIRPPSRRVAEFDDQQWKLLRLILVSARLLDGSIDMSGAVNYDFLKEAYRRPLTFGN